jgi:broad specificity phosphatase PhoE
MIGGAGARTRLVMIRHGRAEGADGRCIGHTDLPLSAHGRATIGDLSVLAPSVVLGSASLVASDLRRAIDSAAILGKALHLSVHSDLRLREMNFGEWDGCSWADLEQNDGERLRGWTDSWLDTAPPAGETVSDVEWRAEHWLRDAAAPLDHVRTIFAVAHAGWIRVAVGLLLGRPVSRLFDTPIDHAHATIVDRFASSAVLVAENSSIF